MKKKGFTLIELLAVIVVLAVIALIAVPNIVKIVNNSRKGAFTRSAESLKRLSDMSYTDNRLTYGDNGLLEFSCDISNKYCQSNDNQKIEFDGILGDGKVTIDTEGNVSFDVTNGTYCAYKYASFDKIYVVDGDCEGKHVVHDTKGPDITIKNVTVTSNRVIINHEITDDTGIQSTSCKYGKGNSLDMEGIMNDNTCTLSNLINNTEYTYEICATDTMLNEECKKGTVTTARIQQPTITFTNTPENTQNGYLLKQVANVSYTTTNVTSPVRYVRTNKAGTSNINVTEWCEPKKDTEGKDLNEPDVTKCHTITGTKTLDANTWYKVTGNLTVTYSGNTEAENIYAILYDGTSFGQAAASATIKTENDKPIVTITDSKTTTNKLTVTSEITDVKSGVGTVKCKYGTTNGTYNINGTLTNSGSTYTCTMSNLSNASTYYYQICANDKVGSGNTCQEGNSGLPPVLNPTITWQGYNASGTAISSINGYVYTDVGTVVYNPTNVERATYYVKSTVAGASNINLNECGTGIDPGTCSNVSTTTMVAGTWYKTSGNLTVTYTTNGVRGTLYAYTYDASNNRGYITGTSANIVDREVPTVTLGSISTTTNRIIVPSTITDTKSGVGTVTCKYGTAYGNYNINGTMASDNTSCTMSGLSNASTYYYQICATDNVGNNACQEGNGGLPAVLNPTITWQGYNISGTAISPINGNVYTDVGTVTYNPTNVERATYYVKSTVAGASNINLNECGTGTDPGTCSNVSTTNMVAGTWYKTSGNLTVTYTTNGVQGNLYAYTYDESGNKGYAGGTSRIIDRAGPTVPTGELRKNNSTGELIALPNSSSVWYNHDLWLGNLKSIDSGSGLNRYEYSNGCTGTKSGDLTIDWSTIYSLNDYTFCIRAVDNVGNESAWSSPIYIKIDKTVPTVAYNVAGGIYNTNKTITITGTDTNFSYMHVHVYKNAALEYLNNVSMTNNITTKTHNVTLNEEGVWTIYTYVSDLAGNILTPTPNNGSGWYYQTYTIDKTAPSITFGTNGSGGSWSKEVTTAISVEENGSGIADLRGRWMEGTVALSSKSDFYSYGGWPFENGDTSKANSVNGYWYLWIYARDNAGNETITHTNEFKLDNTAPTLTLGTVTSTSNSITIPIIEASDVHSGLKAQGCSTGSYTGTISGNNCVISGLSPSTTYAYRMYAEDNAGNVNEISGTITTKASISGTPTITASWPNTTSIKVNVSGMSIDSSDTVSYRYIVDGVTKQDWTTSTSYTFTGLTTASAHTVKVETKATNGGTSGNPKTATIYTSKQVSGTNPGYGSNQLCSSSTYTVAASGVYGAKTLTSPSCSSYQTTDTISCSKTLTGFMRKDDCGSVEHCYSGDYFGDCQLDSVSTISNQIIKGVITEAEDRGNYLSCNNNLNKCSDVIYSSEWNGSVKYQGLFTVDQWNSIEDGCKKYPDIEDCTEKFKEVYESGKGTACVYSGTCTGPKYACNYKGTCSANVTKYTATYSGVVTPTQINY